MFYNSFLLFLFYNFFTSPKFWEMLQNPCDHYVQEKGLSTGPSTISDLCPRIVGRGNRSKVSEGPVLRSFYSVKRNSDRLAGTFRWSEHPSTAWLVPSTSARTSQCSLTGTFHRRRSRLLKIGFFRQVRELKIQRKNPGNALHKST
jgi:hypothetical protein